MLLRASLESSQMIHMFAKVHMYYEKYNFVESIYLAIKHLVSVFNDAGGKICLIHIDVKTTNSEKILTQ
jgi:hypothetical protein